MKLKCLMGRRRESSVWVDDMLRMQENALQGAPIANKTVELCHAWLHSTEQRCLLHMKGEAKGNKRCSYYNEGTLEWVRAERARFLLIVPRNL